MSQRPGRGLGFRAGGGGGGAGGGGGPPGRTPKLGEVVLRSAPGTIPEETRPDRRRDEASSPDVGFISRNVLRLAVFCLQISLQ